MTGELTRCLSLPTDEDVAREVGYYLLQKRSRCGLDHLTRPERVVAVVADLESEVGSGGFEQYFLNGPGDSAREAVAALREVGAVHSAALLSLAIEVFGSEGPDPDRDNRRLQMKALPESACERWCALDLVFDSDDDDQERVAPFVAAYVRKNRSDIAE
jgi:hypothetical protein